MTTESLRRQTTGVSMLERAAAVLFPGAVAQYPLLGVIGARRTADFAYPEDRLAIFVDGCMWHGCSWHAQVAKLHEYDWPTKIARTRARDADTVARLGAAGWVALRVWEHSLRCPVCDEDEPLHPVDPACAMCRGTGHFVGGDATRPCPACRRSARGPSGNLTKVPAREGSRETKNAPGSRRTRGTKAPPKTGDT